MISLDMRSFCPQDRVLTSPWRPRNLGLLVSLDSKKKVSFISSIVCSSVNDESFSVRKQTHLGYSPPEELFGLDVELKPRKARSDTPEPRSWFGPSGQYIRELPCPSCRGRGYGPCTECGIERSRSDCPKCSGKGIVTCHQCLGDCVIWEESIDEQPWENARST